MTRPVSAEAKAALALIMTGAGVSLITAELDAGDGQGVLVDVICHSITINGDEAQVRPLAIVVDEAFLRLLRPPENWEVRHGDG